MAILKTLRVRLIADAAELTKGLDAAAEKLAKAGKKMKGVGQDLTRHVTLPIVAIGAAAIKMGSDFEAEMSKIVGLVGVSQDQVGEWSEELRRLGPELGKSPKELAEALFFVTSAGFRGAEAIDVLVASAKASAAGLGDTASVADAVTSAVNAYGSEILSAGRATDILTAAVREGKLQASELAPVMGVVVPTAAAMGVSFEEVAGTLAVFSKTGVSASEGATQLNSIMSAMLNTTGAAEKALEGAGLSLTDLRAIAAGPGGLIGAMRALDEAFQGNTDELAVVVPNTRAFRGVMNALAQDSDAVDAVMRGVADSTGSVDAAFEAASETVKFQTTQSWEKMRDALLELSDAVMPFFVSALSKVSDAIQKLGKWFGGLSPKMQKTVVIVGALVAAIGPLLVVVGTVLTVLPQMVAGIGLVSAALKLLAASAGPIGLAVLAIGTIITIGVLVIKHWDEIKEAARRVGQWIKDKFGDMATYVKDVVHAMVNAVRDYFVGGFTRIVDSIKTQIDRVKGFFGGLAHTLVGGSIIPEMVDSIGQQFKRMNLEMVTLTAAGTARVESEFSAMNQDVSMSTSDVVGRVTDLFGEFGVKVPSIVSDLVGDVETKWSRIKSVLEIPTANVLKKQVDDWWEFAKEIVSVLKWIWDKAKDVISNLSGALQFGGNINIQTGGLGGGGSWIPGTTGPIVGPTGTDQFTTSYEWAQQFVYLSNMQRFLEEIRDNTALLKKLGTGAGPEPDPRIHSGNTAASNAEAIDAGLEQLVSRRNRAAGFVEIS